MTYSTQHDMHQHHWITCSTRNGTTCMTCSTRKARPASISHYLHTPSTRKARHASTSHSLHTLSARQDKRQHHWMTCSARHDMHDLQHTARHISTSRSLHTPGTRHDKRQHLWMTCSARQDIQLQTCTSHHSMTCNTRGKESIQNISPAFALGHESYLT